MFYASFKLGDGGGRDKLGRYYNYPTQEWLRATYDAVGGWISIAADTSTLQSFDGAPATMLHLTVRKPAA